MNDVALCANEVDFFIFPCYTRFKGVDVMQTFVSDTLASSAAQTFFKSDGKEHLCRIYYKVFESNM